MGKFIPMKLPESSMKNIYRIVWTDEALNNLRSIIEYFEKNWTEREIKKFVKSLSLLASNPNSFPSINHPKNLRKVVISKQTSIFYQLIENQIRIVSLFDNRRNPDWLKKI
jgi:plasmid stabilization system protein ParE